MFGVLVKGKVSPSNLLVKTRSLFAGPKNQNSLGATMKFEFGNGDKPLDGYVIKRGVGVGGFGEVYFAESDSGKEVALKRIQKNLEVEVRGVRHCLNLRHPNLVAIYDIRFDSKEQGWIVMEYVTGDSLRDRIDQFDSSTPPDETIETFAQLVAGVTYLHDQGIVHRDLKPANIFIEHGLVKIGDYGLSKYISVSRRGGQTESVGTFHYMAPEIGRGEYGKEVDIYALGVIFFEMLTGNVPFDGQSSQEIILKHLTADPDLSMLAQPYRDTIQRALSKDPQHRYHDGRELLAALGWKIDRSGLATRDSNATAAPMPIVAAGAMPASKGRTPHSPTGNKGNAGNYAWNANTQWHGNSEQASLASNPPVKYREPIARYFHRSLWDLQRYLDSLTPGKRTAANVILLIGMMFFLINGGLVLAPIALMWYGMYYICYRIARSFLEQDETPDPRAYLPVVASIPQSRVCSDTVSPPVLSPSKSTPRQRPITLKAARRMWVADERVKLAEMGPWSKLYARTHSWAFSGSLIGALAILAYAVFKFRFGETESQWIASLVWTAVMSVLTSWSILFFAKRWETKQEDTLAYRIVLMICGIGLGVVSSGLSQYLHATSTAVWSLTPSLDSQKYLLGEWAWLRFYNEVGVPLLPAHVAFFACLLGMVRWWRQADVLRRRRFSVFSIVASVVIASIIRTLFAFSPIWCVLLAGVVSFTIQVASPWKKFQDPRTA